MKILCVFGEHQYGEPSRGLGTEYAAFVPALKRLGHQVVHFESWDRNRFADFKELNLGLIQTVRREGPDVLLAVQSHVEIWMETLDLLRATSDVVLVNWTTDDLWKYERVSRYVGRHYDLMTTTCRLSVPKYRRDGIPNVLLTQWAARTEHLREPLPATECIYQVSFVGAAHGNRRERIAALCEKGIEVTCFGHGWESGPVAADDIPEIMRQSVISLNFANSAWSWDGAFPRRLNQIKARVFEVTGAGGFLLTGGADDLERYLTPGREIVVFSGDTDLAEKIRLYLTHSEERDRIAWAGYRRARRDHTYEKRMGDVLELALEIRASDQTSRTPASIREAEARFETALAGHVQSWSLKAFRSLLVSAASVVWGRRRGVRAARRIAFEAGWRFAGERIYRAGGWPGRMFPDVKNHA
jgi:spore maturation protein CgeB